MLPRPNQELKRQENPKKKRSFTGCYTCRQRKIKCDNTRPSCQRCTKSKLECLGYDIKLQWSRPLIVQHDTLVEMVEPEAVGEDRKALLTKRRNIEFVKYDHVYQFDQELDNDIEFCNNVNLKRSNKESIRKGPFAVFNGEYFGLLQQHRKPILPIEAQTPLIPRNELMIRANDSDLRSTSTSTPRYQSSTQEDFDEEEEGEEEEEEGEGEEEEEEEEEEENEEDENSKVVEVWIDKRFIREAHDTYCFLINEIIPTNHVDINRVIFAKYFDLKNVGSIKSLISKRRHDKTGGVVKKGIIMNDLFNVLIRYFIGNIHLMMPITFKGNIYETLVVPTIYKFIGQIMTAHEDSFILNTKKSIIKQVLCLSSYFKYESSNDSRYLSFSIKLRLEIMVEMCELIINLTDENGEFVDNQYMDELLETYEIKNIVLLFILMVKIDFFVQILENFTTWFKTMDKLIEFLNNYNDSILNNLTFSNVNEKLTLDKFSNLKKLIKLYRFIKIFYFSTAKIDFNNYVFKNDANDEEFDEIVDEDYDLLKGDFIFDDGFSKIDDYIDMLFKKPHLMDPENLSLEFNHEPGDHEKRLENNTNNGSDGTILKPHHHQRQNNTVEEKKFVMIDIPKPDNDTVFIGDIEDDVNKFSSVEYMYGLPLSLLELFNKIITLTNHKNFFTRRNLFPKNYPKLCSDLEDDLMNWKLTWRLLDEQGRYKSTFHEILYHNILSFYNSLCIYFERIIKESDPSTLQNYVQNSLGHLVKLLNVDDVNLKISPLFWSFFISSCDAIDPDLQMRFAQISPLFIGSNWISKQIIMEVWKKRQEGFHEVCWLDIVKIWDCDVLLLC